MDNSYNLQRFVEAQNAIEFGNTVYFNACSELCRGHKSTHWMWFIFPQVAGVASDPSNYSKFFAIASLAETKAYLANPTLGPRLHECCELLLKIEGRSIEEVMGYPDDLKLKSSMTLFSQATESNALFLSVLSKYFNGEPDAATLKLLRQ